MKKKLFFGMLTAAATLAVTPAAFADDPTNTASVDYNYQIQYKRGSYKDNYSFTGIGISVSGTAGDFTLTGSESSAISGKSVVFIGSGATDETTGNLIDSVTIKSANIDNGTYTSGYTSTNDVFAVEGCTVIIDGVTINDLGMNLTVGTMYGVGDAELIITGGANVTTSAIYNTVGSNLATGTITITGEGSTLSNQQITLGGGVNSLYPGSSSANGDYQTKWFVDDDTYASIRDTLVSSEFDPTSGSYGIVNVTEGGTWQVGVGNTNSSNNRIQLANGEINIDGGSLIFGKNSSLLMMNESLFSNSDTGGVYTGMNISETVTVTNGGTVSVETDTNGNAQTMAQLVIGDTYVASNVTAAVSVDGSDDSGNASSFIISASTAVYIGTNSGYWTNTGTSIAKYDGGTADVTVSATNGGVIDISSTGGMVICADNYATYIGATADGNKYEDVGHSYGLTVALTAESGGSLTLATTDGSTVLLAAGSPADGEYTNTLTITAKGEGSSVAISGGDIYTNLGDTGEGSAAVSVEITATNGGKIALSAAKVDSTGNGVISFGLNTQVTVEKGSSLTTEGIISFESGSSISVDATSTWKTTSSVTFNEGSGLAVGAAAVASGTNDVSVALGEVTIAESASITVTIDISALGDYTEASVAILTAESIIFGGQSGTTLTSDNVETFANGYITLTEGDFILESWSYVANNDGTNTLYANIVTMPEPSMFGMLFGLSALGLVSTRRRRRKA